jgi:hypothetical protein
MDLCGRLADDGGDVTEGHLKRLSLMGAAVFAGMIGVTLFGLLLTPVFLTPVFFTTLRKLAGRKRAPVAAVEEGAGHASFAGGKEGA